MTVGLDMGWGWRRRGEERPRLLTWWADNGAVTLDGPGGCEFLGTIAAEAAARRAFAEWADHCDAPGGVDWVRRRIASASCDACDGKGWVTTRAVAGAVDEACPACSTVAAR